MAQALQHTLARNGIIDTALCGELVFSCQKCGRHLVIDIDHKPYRFVRALCQCENLVDYVEGSENMGGWDTLASGADNWEP